MGANSRLEWADQPVAPIMGCAAHRPFPTSYCKVCRAMFDAANPGWRGPYPDEATDIEESADAG